MKESWLASNSDIVGYMDVDLATDLKHIEEIYDIFINEDSSIVIGSRLLEESKIIDRTIIRAITSRIFNILFKNILKVNISDGMCGFKFFDDDTAKSLVNKGISSDNWIFPTEILAKAKWLGYKITEIPIVWTDDKNRKSKVKIMHLSIEFLFNLLKLRLIRKDYLK